MPPASAASIRLNALCLRCSRSNKHWLLHMLRWSHNALLHASLHACAHCCRGKKGRMGDIRGERKRGLSWKLKQPSSGTTLKGRPPHVDVCAKGGESKKSFICLLFLFGFNIPYCALEMVYFIHAGAFFAYQLLYLLDGTQFFTPALHLMQIYVARASGQELMDATSRLAERRKRDLERLRGPPLIQAVQRGLLRTIYTTLDYAQTSLIAAVFLFKMLEWWYQSAEQRITAPTVYPPPPPPPQPKVADKGIPLPLDKRVCPLCSELRTNPAMISASGFVFCYPCIFKYVNQYKRCPITLMPATAEQIRRLYRDT